METTVYDATLETLDAVREWVESGIAESLDKDPSGFLLGIESVSVLDALAEIKKALRDDGEAGA